jgi:hypothetical protein
MKTITGVKILYLLREGHAGNWDDLVKRFELGSISRSPILRHALDELRRVGLIEFDDAGGSFEYVKGTIGLTPHWTKVQGALGFSLKQAAEDPNPDAMTVVPVLGKPKGDLSSVPAILVLMPFLPSLKDVYHEHIAAVAKRVGKTVGRADDFFNAHFVMADIWEGICGAQAIIADCTGRNANVFYEIGLAHAIGKPVIVISQNSDDIPFDLKYLRYIRYEYTPPGMRQFEETLFATLRSTFMGNGRPKPVSQELERMRREEDYKASLQRSLEDAREVLQAGLTCPQCGSAGNSSSEFRVVAGASGPWFVCRKCERRIDGPGYKR